MSFGMQIRLVHLAREIWGDEAARQLCEKFGLSPALLDQILPDEEEDLS